MEKLTLQQGVTLEPQMNDHLSTIMEEMSEDVPKMNEEQSFRRLFWEQQLQAIQRILDKFVGFQHLSKLMVLTPQV